MITGTQVLAGTWGDEPGTQNTSRFKTKQISNVPPDQCELGKSKAYALKSSEAP
jgi:hypothetical protein